MLGQGGSIKNKITKLKRFLKSVWNLLNKNWSNQNKNWND